MQDVKFWLPRRRRRPSLACRAGYLIERGLCAADADIDGGRQCELARSNTSSGYREQARPEGLGNKAF